MKEFDITLTATSTKSFRLSADSRDEALDLVDSLLEHSSLLEFGDSDVSEVDVECEEICGGVCEVCSNACEICGDCNELEPDCDHPEKDCEYRCPLCGGCMYDDEDED